MRLGEIHHACVGVSDLERSLRFYRDLLGFRVTLQGGFDDEEHARLLRLPSGYSGRVATVQPPGTVTGAVELIELKVPGHEPAQPARPGDIGVFMLSFEVKETTLAEAVERLRAAGVEFWTEPIAIDVPDYGAIESVVCEDPDGILVELLTLPSVEEVRALRAARRKDAQPGS